MNYKNPAIKRILADVRELERHPSSRYSAAPLEENFFEWHFTIRGPSGSDFDGGMYHGRILLSPEYPFKPPNIVFMTKNGRFEVGTKICLSISAYHEESWQPAWGVRTMLEAIISFMPSEGNGAIGALDWTKAERQRLVKESHSFCCGLCGPICKLLSDPIENEVDIPSADIAEQISQLRFESKTGDSSGKANGAKISSEIGINGTSISSEDERKPAADNVKTENSDSSDSSIERRISSESIESSANTGMDIIKSNEKNTTKPLSITNESVRSYSEDVAANDMTENSGSGCNNSGSSNTQTSSNVTSTRRRVSVERMLNHQRNAVPPQTTSAPAVVNGQEPGARVIVEDNVNMMNQPLIQPIINREQAYDWIDQMLGGLLLVMNYYIGYLAYKEVTIIFFGHYFE